MGNGIDEGVKLAGARCMTSMRVQQSVEAGSGSQHTARATLDVGSSSPQ